MLRHLVLFDIDGTLLTTNGQAGNAMMAAYRTAYGIVPDKGRLLMDGKTELCIAHELLGAAGLSRAEIKAGLARYWRAYADALREGLRPEKMTVHPGVRSLLRRLAGREDILVGLLTGNIEAAARIKLGAVGLEGFACGAFGEHHEQRSDLPQVALRAARAASGMGFAGKSVTIVGDTPADILCGARLGVNAVAVATGKFSMGELAGHRPDSLFADLSDTNAVMQAIAEPGAFPPDGPAQAPPHDPGGQR